MAISRQTRDRLLVEARHRCTICSEKCFEIHHIVEQADGGGDEPDNLIVLCPNCHQHRYHRSGEFTRDQLRLYKQKLREQNEVERRLLLNLEEIKSQIGHLASSEVETNLRRELAEASELVTPERAPGVAAAVGSAAQWLAERELLKGGARRAIEVEWELDRARSKDLWPKVSIVGVDEDGYRKAPDFPAAFTFVLRLDRAPRPDWVQLFDQEYHRQFYHMKRKTRIEGDRIVMVVASSDSLQGHVDFAKRLVDSTNGLVERHVWPDIDRQIDAGKAQALQSFDTIKTLRAATKNLRI